MITASHNPFEYNGIKIFGGDGRKLPDLLEDRIESAVLDGAPLPPCSVGGDVGRITRCENAAKDYIDRLRACVTYSPVGLRVAVDCANGAASLTAGELFSSLGVDVTLLSSSPDGINVNNGCGSTHMDALIKTVKSGNFDCGIAFDGDADRCLFVDERGEVVDGDRIMAVCALDLAERGRLNGRTVVGTVMTNLGFSRFCEKNGLHFVATKVGDRFVLEEMLQGDYSFGGEQSGHIIFRDLATTGDGQLTALQLLSIIKHSGKRLSELASVMTVYPQTSRNVAVTHEGKLIFYNDPQIGEALNTARAELGDSGRIIVRPSGTEPLIRVMVEGSDREMIDGIADRVAGIISERIGKVE
jgi:phosphoglucosamine mutase